MVLYGSYARAPWVEHVYSVCRCSAAVKLRVVSSRVVREADGAASREVAGMQVWKSNKP